MSKILIIDDEANLCAILAEAISRKGWTPVCACDLAESRKLINSENFDIVLLDIKLPDGNGLEALPEFINTVSQPEVIIMTGHGHAQAAELALQYGAWDYLKKPFDNNTINLSIKRALEFRRAKLDNQKKRLLKRNGIVGSGLAINEALEQTAEAAGGDHSVLISGETGTGKELFARAIHLNSNRADGHLIVVDCAALSESLIEDSLFGHVKGAYTDARQDQSGLIQMAHQGTLFLDEIGELPLNIQKKFLRVLEEKKFRPLGSTREQISDFRLVSATNRDLEKMVAQGAFRQDLLYRIRSQKLVLPSLRDRQEDIPELVNHYLSRICRRLGMTPKIIQPEFMQCLCAYNWPGNVRELINVLDQANCTARDVSTLFHKHLPMEIRTEAIRQQTQPGDQPARTAESFPIPTAPPDLTSWQEFRDNAEKEYLEQLIARTSGNIREMVKIAGLSKSRVYDLINKHQLNTSPRSDL